MELTITFSEDISDSGFEMAIEWWFQSLDDEDEFKFFQLDKDDPEGKEYYFSTRPKLNESEAFQDFLTEQEFDKYSDWVGEFIAKQRDALKFILEGVWKDTRKKSKSGFKIFTWSELFLKKDVKYKEDCEAKSKEALKIRETLDKPFGEEAYG